MAQRKVIICTDCKKKSTIAHSFSLIVEDLVGVELKI